MTVSSEAPLGHAGALTPMRVAQARAAAGPWRRGAVVGPVPFADRHNIDVLVGIYMVTDAEGRLVYVGQARRNGGVLARLDGHAADRTKREAFSELWVVSLHDRTDPATVNAIEGRTADVLRVRGALNSGGRNRRWPSSAAWMELVGSAAAAVRARLVTD